MPRFVVFYNGTSEQPERRVLRLSDAFEKSVEEPELELKVLMLNINPGRNGAIMEKCSTLRDFLLRNKAEAIQMSIFEYDEERETELLKKTYLEEGEARGKPEEKPEEKPVAEQRVSLCYYPNWEMCRKN